MRTLATLLLVAIASPAAAQVIQPPPRSTGGLFGGDRPLDPNRSSQELTLALVLLGGRDDALAPESQSVAIGPQQSGYVGTAAGTLRYRRGRATRFIEASSRGYVNSYSNLGLPQLVGGDVDLQGLASLGRKTRLTTTISGRYQPTFLMAGVSAGADPFAAGTEPDYSATQGVTEERWLNGSASAGLELDWTRRQTLNIRSDYSKRTSINQTGLDGRDQGGSLSNVWRLRRNASVNTTYRYTDRLSRDGQGLAHPFKAHTIELGMTIQKRWSATRRVEITGGAGATRAFERSSVTNQNHEFIVPSASASVRLDLVRTWALSADLHRDVSILSGVTPQPFITQAASLSAGGTIARRLQLTISAGVARGESRDGATGSFESLNGTGQLRWSFSRWASIMTSYSYYDHLMRDVAALPAGFPARYDRNSVRVGLTVDLPLYGAFRSN